MINLRSTISRPRVSSLPYSFFAEHTYVPSSSRDTGLMIRFPVSKIIRLPPDPITFPSFFQTNDGLGAASGLHTIVTLPPSAAYVSDSIGHFLKEGFNAGISKKYYNNATKMIIVIFIIITQLNIERHVKCSHKTLS